MTRILLVSGSGRTGSTSAAVLRTAADVGGDDVATVRLGGIIELPLFNPDHDREGFPLDARVRGMRAAVAAADAVLVCTPEYAGALPAMLKNALEWTIGDGGLDGKPVAWINAAGPAAPTGGADAHESLGKVLAYANAEVVAAACVRIPVTREMVGADGTIADADAREAIAGAVSTLVAHCAQRAIDPV